MVPAKKKLGVRGRKYRRKEREKTIAMVVDEAIEDRGQRFLKATKSRREGEREMKK